MEKKLRYHKIYAIENKGSLKFVDFLTYCKSTKKAIFINNAQIDEDISLKQRKVRAYNTRAYIEVEILYDYHSFSFTTSQRSASSCCFILSLSLLFKLCATILGRSSVRLLASATLKST